MANTMRPGPRPQTIGAVIREMELTPEDEAVLESKKLAAANRGFSSVEDLEEHERIEAEKAAQNPDPLAARAAVPGEPNELPPWVIIPPNLKFPVGRQVAFLRFPSEWTVRPDKGVIYEGTDSSPAYQGKPHRQCILWSLSIADEKLARVDARGDSLALYPEMAKRMIRAIDGQVVDWSTGAVSRETGVSMATGRPTGERHAHVPTFWEEIGPGPRQLIVNHFHKTHSLDLEKQAHFLLHCCVVRSAVAG